MFAGRIPTKVHRVDYDWVEEYIRKAKQEKHLAPSTIRHKVGATARCFDWLVRKKVLPGNPWRVLPKGYATYSDADAEALAVEGKAVREDLSLDRRLEASTDPMADEERRIMKVFEGEPVVVDGKEVKLLLRNRDALQFMFELDLETGMRLREIFTLWKYQFDLKKKTIFLEKTKNGHKRQVPMGPRARKLAASYLKSIDDGPAFPWIAWDKMDSRDGAQTELKRVTAMLSRQYVRIFETAGCKDLTFHCLRHEATCRLYERTDLSDVEIAKILGWSSLKMALRYANLRGSSLADRLGQRWDLSATA